MRNLAAILFVIGIIALQIFLSKREGRWPGLIMPIITFINACLCPFMMVVPPEGMSSGFVWQMILVWLLSNIPTTVLLVIYFACREKQRRKKQLEKMNIRDLN